MTRRSFGLILVCALVLAQHDCDAWSLGDLASAAGDLANAAKKGAATAAEATMKAAEAAKQAAETAMERPPKRLPKSLDGIFGFIVFKFHCTDTDSNGYVSMGELAADNPSAKRDTVSPLPAVQPAHERH
jgi:hypothetical protein